MRRKLTLLLMFAAIMVVMVISATAGGGAAFAAKGGIPGPPCDGLIGKGGGVVPKAPCEPTPPPAPK